MALMGWRGPEPMSGHLPVIATLPELAGPSGPALFSSASPVLRALTIPK